MNEMEKVYGSWVSLFWHFRNYNNILVINANLYTRVCILAHLFDGDGDGVDCGAGDGG